jgi:hypothetical protein
MNGEDYDLWRCGVCGEILEGNRGLKPVIGSDGWRHIVCPDCRDECPELDIAYDGEMWCDYPAPLVEGDRLPFHLDEWLAPQG